MTRSKSPEKKRAQGPPVERRSQRDAETLPPLSAEDSHTSNRYPSRCRLKFVSCFPSRAVLPMVVEGGRFFRPHPRSKLRNRRRLSVRDSIVADGCGNFWVVT